MKSCLENVIRTFFKKIFHDPQFFSMEASHITSLPLGSEPEKDNICLLNSFMVEQIYQFLNLCSRGLLEQ